jgi:regulatory protein
MTDGDHATDAYQAALRYLARRSHSRWELFTKVTRKGFPRRDINRALDRLEELGYLNDRSFALEYSRYRLKQSPRGRKLLAVELLKRGIARELTEEVLAEVYQEFPEEELVSGLVQKWRRTHPGEITGAEIKKLSQSLGRKGFGWEQIRMGISGLTDEW